MKKTLFTILSLIVIVAMFSFAMAANSENEKAFDKENETAKPEKNMTYGTCVSAGAKEKNACYSSVKGNYSFCKSNAANATDARTAVKECKTSYKKDMSKCKADFKAVKNECRKIKHNFFETARYAFA